MIPFIDLKAQYRAIHDEVKTRIHRVLEHGQYIMGPEVFELEERLADYVGVKHCIAASSGTDTLLIALMALDVKSGDEVITTPFTFIATGEMIALAGAKPVFVDIDPCTHNIDPSKIEAAITHRTRAVMPVSLYGRCADMDAINEIASRHGLAVVEDAAQSFGAEYKGQKSCGLSTIGSTSFFPSKPLGCYGDGGALFTNDDNLAKIMREIRVHGQDRRYHHARIGLNGRMDTIQAAVLLTKLDKFDWELSERRTIAARYDGLLSSTLGPEALPSIADESGCSVFAQYTILIEDRDGFCDYMKNEGVPTAVHYPSPLHLQPAFGYLGHKAGDFPMAESSARRVVSLPMSPYLDRNDQARIADLVVNWYQTKATGSSDRES